MPHIVITCCNTAKNVEQLNIHVYVKFSNAYYKQKIKSEAKLHELKKKLEEIAEQYFENDYQSNESMSNHEYNVFNKS